MISPPSYIAVVDDDSSVRNSLGRLLRAEGLEVKTFSSAEEFLALVDSNRPRCLVLDVHMPDMDGLALQSELSRRSVNVPIIFITAHQNEDLHKRIRRSGAVDLLVKPFTTSRLLEAIYNAISPNP